MKRRHSPCNKGTAQRQQCVPQIKQCPQKAKRNFGNGVGDSNNIKHRARAFLDSCAQSNFISESLCKLKLKRFPVNTQVILFNQPGPKVKYKCELEIAARNGGFRFTTFCLVAPKIVDGVSPNETVDLKDVQILSHLKLADPAFNIPKQVDLLIGAQNGFVTSYA